MESQTRPCKAYGYAASTVNQTTIERGAPKGIKKDEVGIFQPVHHMKFLCNVVPARNERREKYTRNEDWVFAKET